MSERDPVCKVCGTAMSEHPYLGLPCERFSLMQTDNPSAPDYDWQADREWFNQRLANARIHNNELEKELAAKVRRISDLAVQAADRIAELEACVLEYWNAKDWDAIGAADCTAAKLVDMKAGAAKIADTSLTPTVDRGGEHGN